MPDAELVKGYAEDDGDGMELLACAAINFQNVEGMIPGIATHPIFALAFVQLLGAKARLEREEGR